MRDSYFQKLAAAFVISLILLAVVGVAKLLGWAAVR